ncbi:MAG: metal-dependent transcriptional regulator [Candidatus Aenigmarchaeota archaeon]|nr:metal-dependent transcriptional regulator [Candidatus Aenigmarchaeota archaeon]
MEISQSVEDYLEAIYLAEADKGHVRVKDIALKLDIKLSSVTGMFKKLEEEGFIKSEKYGPVELTQKGKVIARGVYSKHKLLNKFFLLLGVDKKIALEDACRAEHVLSKKTLDKIRKFVNEKGN